MHPLSLASFRPRGLTSWLRRFLVRLRRRPRREHEWRRLILAVRSVQQGQILLVERIETLSALQPDTTPVLDELCDLRNALARVEQLGLDQLERVRNLAEATSSDRRAEAREVELVGALEARKEELVREREALRNATTHITALEERLRSADLARAEADARQAKELAQVVDHARGHIERLEEDLKKKKRGLAALTEENIRLQTALQKQPEVHPAAPASKAKKPDEPPPALPSGKSKRSSRSSDSGERGGRGPVTPG